ncbi:DUF1345 domain-containing protein [Schumannella sp. 10F1B-5-1]|uniref:DUF1345 domain-containing protein n=1 Tax=Schumannella sp. 10F1B-5-1 TaxID=2590780 RepID=UPI001130AAC2|nr:DUF1345 domain-containing protein [Schumannella sp. 10F1B-5-1]TPW71521.1 DUF1345 domain-containing protein [Schumannella sp. 10F1B-5-1]
MARRTRDAPVLASDVVRHYIALGTMFVLSLPLGWALGAVGLARRDPVSVSLVIILALWAVMAVVMIVLATVAFGRATSGELMRGLRATNPRRGRLWRLWWGFNGGGAIYWAGGGTATTLIALLAIAVLGGIVTSPGLLLLGGVITIATSFAANIVSYAVRYARAYAEEGGLEFPGGAEPRFADFVYFAAQVSTTFAGSDVQVRSTAMRKIVTVHSILSFTFNTVVVALGVSLLVGGID